MSIDRTKLQSLKFTLIGLVFISGCAASNAKSNPKNIKETVPVYIAKAEQKTIPLKIQVMGTVEAYNVISVKSQINGEIKAVYFTQGQDVNKGDLLFKIDSRPLEAALSQAEANLEKDKAQLQQALAKVEADKAQIQQAEAKVEADKAQVQQAQAKVVADMAQIKQADANLTKSNAQANQSEIEASRYEQLVNEGAVSKSQYDKLRADADAQNASSLASSASVENAKAAVGQSKALVENARSAVGQSTAAIANAKAALNASKAAVKNVEAVIKADEAAVENAKVQLSYTSIFSPINGRVGTIAVNQGNVVKSNDTTMVEIKQINPIYVTFAVPQQQLSLIRKYMDKDSIKVQTIIPKDEKNPLTGNLTFIDNAVDNSTGTVKLKATFDNPNSKLWPGLFVNVVINLSQEKNAVVIPSQALQTGQKGQYVFVVNPDMTVEDRVVIVSRTVDGEAVIEKGLKPGEQIVTDGQLRLKKGAAVSIKQDSNFNNNNQAQEENK